VRCGETCFTTNPPHLCRDIRKRHERQEAAVRLVVEILAGEYASDEDRALAIIAALSGRDLGV